MTSGKLAEKRCSGNRARAGEASKRREATMSLHPEKIEEVPEETARVAKACFPKGNRYLRLRDTLGTMFADHEFADLFPRRGQPAEAPWRLALVCLVQSMDELTDRQAADAVRSRMDIK
jgi:transposase